MFPEGTDIRGSPPAGNERTKQIRENIRREVVATFDYTDAQGALTYQVCRFQFRLPDGSWELGKKGKAKKTFAQRRPDPDNPGGWINNLEGVPHGLYRLLELRESGLDEPVYLPEGEAKVDQLMAWGLTATCNSGGAQNWREDHAEALRDRDVVILVDNDAPGRERGDKIAVSLHGIAKRIRILDFAALAWPGAPVGADVLDWAKAREGTPEELAELVADLPDWQPAPFKSSFGGRRWEEIGMGNGDAYPWIIEDVVPEGEAVLIFGESGSGKSFNAFDMAMCIARGIRFNGYNVEPGLVIYAAAEAGKGFEKRKRAYVDEHGLDPGAPLPFYLMTRKFDLFHGEEHANALIAEMQTIRAMYGVPLRAVFLDTLSATTPGMNENASQDVSPVKNRIDRIRVEVGCTVILIHHKPKGGSTPRGHGSLTADFETTIEYETSEMVDDEGRRLHVATVQKQREGKSGMAWRFALKVRDVGRNKWGNAETSCVVIPASGGAGEKGHKASDNQVAFMRALYAATDAHGVPPGQVGISLPVNILKVVNGDHVRAEFRKRIIREGGDEKAHADKIRQAWKRSTADLRKAGVLGYEDPFMWWTGKLVRGV